MLKKTLSHTAGMIYAPVVVGGRGALVPGVLRRTPPAASLRLRSRHPEHLPDRLVRLAVRLVTFRQILPPPSPRKGETAIYRTHPHVRTQQVLKNSSTICELG